jgi:hypothetical protein
MRLGDFLLYTITILIIVVLQIRNIKAIIKKEKTDLWFVSYMGLGSNFFIWIGNVIVISTIIGLTLGALLFYLINLSIWDYKLFC